MRGATRAWGFLAIACVAYHAVAMVLLHLLATGVHPLRDMVGAYLETPWAGLSRTTFLALGCALGALGGGLASASPSNRSKSAAAGLLLLSGVGFLGVAAAPGAVQPIGSLLRPVTLLSILVASIALRRQPPWRPVGAALVALAAALLATFAVTFGLLVDLELGGLANRLVLVLIYGWCLLVARGLAAPPGTEG